MSSTLSNYKFLEKLKLKGNYNENYDYSLVDYEKCDLKIIIIDKRFNSKHLISPEKLYGGTKCSIQNCIDKEEYLIKKFNKIHNNYYDYSEFKYKGMRSKIKIKCPEHGYFHQSINSHLKGHGCGRCNGSYTLSEDEIIKEFNKIHNNYYDYSLMEYKNMKTHIKIICPEHGPFKQVPYSHKIGTGCSKCSGNKKLNTKEVIEHFKKVHNNTYNYDKFEYKNASTKSVVICKKHGEFKVTPHNHKRGRGCPKCKMSYGEKEIMFTLDKHKIKYIYQKRFENCRNKYPLPFDFYLPDYNICIEYDGVQHFTTYEFFGGEKEFKKRVKFDAIKNKYCKEKNIKLIRISYYEYDLIEYEILKQLKH